MNCLILISPDRAWGFQPILCGKRFFAADSMLGFWKGLKMGVAAAMV
ncbi:MULTISPECIES: hypothetical protein [unclassified Microcoleus]|jgi:hypothetical protein|nr:MULTISPECIES: hypothetical protein [unclassified Microcoleus]